MNQKFPMMPRRECHELAGARVSHPRVFPAPERAGGTPALRLSRFSGMNRKPGQLGDFPASLGPVFRVALAAALFLWLGTGSLPAQVTFIDAGTLADTAATAPARERPVRLTVAVLRFLPQSRAGRYVGLLPTNGPLTQVVAALGKQGQVNLLYLGDRDLAGATNAAACFDSAERRPAFSLHAAANASLTNRQFGLHLRVAARPAAGGRAELEWDGQFSWSPDLIDGWAGEKYLLFGMRVASVLKPGSVYSDDDDDEGRGINIGGLFKKKPKEPKPASVAPDLSFLIAERREVALRGHQLAQPEELVITAVPSPAHDPKQPEFLYLIQQFTWAD